MRLPRFVGLTDLAMAIVLLVALVLPPRPMYAKPAAPGSDADRFALALAEARTIADPDDGATAAELARRLGEAGFKDWAIQSAYAGSERAKQSPTRWRALIATSVAYVDRLDVVPALDFANRALAACEAAREAGHTTCPSWEEVRMQFYQKHLDAGVKSGIDPRVDPAGFRRAGEGALRPVRIKGGGPSTRTPAPAPAPASPK
jgi:hypothetical protein